MSLWSYDDDLTGEGKLSSFVLYRNVRVDASYSSGRVAGCTPKFVNVHVDVRILSATNAQLHEEARAGNFREDLLFRINTVEIHLPALRERREDIPLLAGHFLRRNRARYCKQVDGFSPAAIQQLMIYSWPGNVRELEHTVERAVLLCRGDKIEPANLAVSSSRPASGPPESISENMSIDEVESLLIRKVLRRCDGNISQAAESLGLSRAALYRRIEKYGL